MNQQEKELLLKDLCSRLPYGVNCKILGALVGARVDESHEPSLRMNGIDMDMAWFTDGGRVGYSMVKFKPVLHPITCLNQEITVNGETFVPIVELAEIGEPVYFSEENLFSRSDNGMYGCAWKKDENAYCFGFFPDTCSFFIKSDSNEYLFVTNQQRMFDKLNEWHINFRLPDHLFVPVTETFNPYKS